MADPWVQVFDEQLSQSQQSEAKAPAGEGHGIPDEITRERTASALIAACGVELPIPPDVG
ncbi:MAG: hypothetical protein WBP65_24785 [Candidatus Sulfotelmatobacter sp.]